MKYFKIKLIVIIIAAAAITSVLLMTMQLQYSFVKPEDNVSESLTGKYLSGEYAKNQYDMETAAEMFTSALKQAGDDPFFLENSYKLELQAGNSTDAISYAREYLKLSPYSPSANILLALDALKNNDHTGAIAYLDSARHNGSSQLSYNIDVVIIPFIKAWVLVGEKKYDEAMNIINSLDNKDEIPSRFLFYQKALIYDIADNIEFADDYYNKIFPTKTLVKRHFIRAAFNFYARQQNYEKAQSLLGLYDEQYSQNNYFTEERSIISDKSIPERIIKNELYGISEVLLEATRALTSVGYADDALSYLRMVEYINPDNDEAKMLIADYFESKNDLTTALDYYNQINNSSDFYVDSQINIGEIYYKTDKKRKGTSLLENVDEGNVVVKRSLLTLADLLRKDKDYSEAARIYSQIISKIEKIESHNWPIFFARGICFERSKQWEKAEKDFLKALEISPNQPDVLNYLGYSWIDQNKNIEQARDMIQKAVTARPDDAQILDSMGWALFKIKDFTEAAKYLEKAIEIIPNDPVINDHLGDVYWMLDRKNEAVFQWNRSVKFHDGNEDISIDDVNSKIKNGLLADKK